MMELGDKLIKAGVLYADDTPVEQMREVSRQLWQQCVALLHLGSNSSVHTSPKAWTVPYV
jgi:hypothetical protein